MTFRLTGPCILLPFSLVAEPKAHSFSFSRGEAGVAIVLKRLDLALKDNDRIYATVSVSVSRTLAMRARIHGFSQILGTGINSSGSAAPVNAPVAAAQHDAMRRAWSQTEREPREVDFVELHATGQIYFGPPRGYFPDPPSPRHCCGGPCRSKLGWRSLLSRR